MELDIIVLKDELYHVVKYAKNVIDCFDMCDVIRDNITTYIESINRHIIKEGMRAGGQFFGCMCR